MFSFINSLILKWVGFIAQVHSVLFLIVIGTPLISFEGGIPRIAGVIIKKFLSVFVAILLGLSIVFVFPPLLNTLFEFLIKQFVDFTIPSLIILAGLAMWVWDRKMRWDYKWYWIPLLVVGLLLIILELFLY